MHAALERGGDVVLRMHARGGRLERVGPAVALHQCYDLADIAQDVVVPDEAPVLVAEAAERQARVIDARYMDEPGPVREHPHLAREKVVEGVVDEAEAVAEIQIIDRRDRVRLEAE